MLFLNLNVIIGISYFRRGGRKDLELYVRKDHIIHEAYVIVLWGGREVRGNSH